MREGNNFASDWHFDEAFNEQEHSACVSAAVSAVDQEMQEALDSATVEGRRDLTEQLDTTLAYRTQTFADTLSDQSGRQFVGARKREASTLGDQVEPTKKDFAGG